jgi:hypothetical protein
MLEQRKELSKVEELVQELNIDPQEARKIAETLGFLPPSGCSPQVALQMMKVGMIKELSDEMVKRLQVQVGNRDKEVAHICADDILCELLRELGYTEVVEKYHEVSKWYS